jgi:recA bacterial DNA recombination protein
MPRFGMAASRIIDLRKLLAERFPQEPLPSTDRLVTGLRIFDEALDGGLTKGAITELTSPPASAGSASLVVALLLRACRDRSFIALIDGRDSFDPQSIGRAALRHLLWVRCRRAAEAIQASDLLLRDGNFPLVILDLVLSPLAELRKIPPSNWYRLQRLVEPAPTAFLVLTRHSMISSAQWKLALENRWTLPQLDREAVDLQAQLKMRVQRAQLNKWRSEREIARAG